MIKPQKLKPCACIITDGNPSFAVCTEFERGFPEPMETPLPTPLLSSTANITLMMLHYNAHMEKQPSSSVLDLQQGVF